MKAGFVDTGPGRYRLVCGRLTSGLNCGFAVASTGVGFVVAVDIATTGIGADLLLVFGLLRLAIHIKITDKLYRIIIGAAIKN